MEGSIDNIHLIAPDSAELKNTFRFGRIRAFSYARVYSPFYVSYLQCKTNVSVDVLNEDLLFVRGALNPCQRAGTAKCEQCECCSGDIIDDIPCM